MHTSETQTHALYLDDDGATLEGEGHSARVELLPNGWSVRTSVYGGDDHPPDCRGLLRATCQLVDQLYRSPRRKTPPLSQGLFAQKSIPLTLNDDEGIDRLMRLLYDQWVARALAHRADLAPLFHKRPIRDELIVCGALSFLKIPYVVDDALTYRGARTVFAQPAHFYGWRHDTPFRQKIPGFVRWRSALSAKRAQANRSLQLTIDRYLENEYDENSRVDFREENRRIDNYITQLRRFRLERPVKSRLHLYFLGEYGDLVGFRADRYPERFSLLQRASEMELHGILEETAQIWRHLDDVSLLPLICRALHNVDDVPLHGGLRAWKHEAFRHLQRRDGRITPMRVVYREDIITGKGPQKPPLPLPENRAIRFLGTTSAFAEEATRMKHCILAKLPRAQKGKCFYFHVDFQGESATVEVGRSGALLEAYGPHNRINHASLQGRIWLERWSLGFLLLRLLKMDRFASGLSANEAGEAPVLSRADPLFPIWQALQRAPQTPEQLTQFLKKACPLYVTYQTHFQFDDEGIRLNNHNGKAWICFDDNGKPCTKRGQKAKAIPRDTKALVDGRVAPVKTELPAPPKPKVPPPRQDGTFFHLLGM